MTLIMTYLQLRQVVCMVKYQNIGYRLYQIYDDVSEIILRYRVCNKTHDQKLQRKTKSKQNKNFFCKQVVYIYIYCMYDKLNYEIWVFIIKKFRMWMMYNQIYLESCKRRRVN